MTVQRSTWWPAARRRSARGGVGLLWVLGAILSYSALRDLALMLGIRDPLAYVFPLVVDVAVWVGSMNALEARDQRREGVERYAWFLVGLYAVATVVGNVVVGATETLDPRLVHALGPDAARWAAEIAGSAPAVTMILFSHLAGLLMEGRPSPAPVTAPAPPIVAAEAISADVHPAIPAAAPAELVAAPAVMPMATVTAMAAAVGRPSDDQADDRQADREPAIVAAADASLDGPADDQVVTAEEPRPRPRAGRPMTALDDRDEAPSMTAPAAKRAAVRMVRRAHSGGRPVTAEDIRKATGRSARQARRLLTEAEAEVGVPPARRPRVITSTEAPAAASATAQEA